MHSIFDAVNGGGPASYQGGEVQSLDMNRYARRVSGNPISSYTAFSCAKRMDDIDDTLLQQALMLSLQEYERYCHPYRLYRCF